MMTTAEYENMLSSQLYRLIGTVYDEVSQLPSEQNIDRWTRNDVNTALRRCMDAFIVAQSCAIRLSRLGELDGASTFWIDELTTYEDRFRSQIEHVESIVIHR
ncbi:MAG: hypothetical protein HKL85_12540 [Acidimicrobiaceae bacterium]|nr:hypothetical protein [Acidimicrobiaceae bacterium]